MKVKNLKFNFTTYLGLLFLVLIFAMIYFQDFIFDIITTQTGGTEILQSEKATKETADLLISLDKITLDTSVLNSTYLQSLGQLPSFPIDAAALSNFGKANPFLGSFIIVPSRVASSSVGGVVYSNQRGANNGNSLRAVNPRGRR
jgi:hypothetical protein